MADLKVIDWREREDLITEPGLYRMSDEQYHADPCAQPSLSASLIKKALPLGSGTGTPRHLWHNHPRLNPAFEREDSNRFDLGSVFHSLILGQGQEIEVIEAKDWRTKAAKEQRDAALEANRQPVLADQFARARHMERAAWDQIALREDLAKAMAAGQPELVLIWIEETANGSIWCRAKLDWLPLEGRIFPDWKTTAASAGPDEYGRTLFDIGADLQAAFYPRGIKAVLGREAELVFPVIETAEPHCMMVHNVGPASASMARRKVQYAINLYAMCLAENVWPGFPIETASQEAPPWIESKWTDREDAGMCSGDFNRFMIEQWSKGQ